MRVALIALLFFTKYTGIFAQERTDSLIILDLDKVTGNTIPDAIVEIDSENGSTFEGKTDENGELIYTVNSWDGLAIRVHKLGYLVAKGIETFGLDTHVYFHEYRLIPHSGCEGLIPSIYFKNNSTDYDGHDSLVMFVKQILIDNPDVHIGIVPSVASNEDPALRSIRGQKVRQAIIDEGGDETRIHVYLGDKATFFTDEQIKNAPEEERTWMEKTARSVQTRAMSLEEVKDSKRKKWIDF